VYGVRTAVRTPSEEVVYVIPPVEGGSEVFGL
jgi:hypothetical protein